MKRPRGTGSLFRRGRIWFVQYFVNGDRRRESSGSEDKKIAEALLRKRLGEVATGMHLGLVAQAVTMGQLIELHIADQKFRKLRDAKTNEWRAAAHFDEKFRSQAAVKFSTADAERYIAARRAEGDQDSTINREMAIITHGFTLGHRKGLVTWEPPYIPHLAEDNARQGFLEPETYEKLLGELPPHLKAFFVCAYHLGTRKGELRKVRWDQVDFEAGIIRLEQAQTKGKRPRTLPIYGDMERWLRSQQDNAAPGCPWVFHYQTRQVGEHMKGWRKACERAGVPGLLPHDLRRSAVRNMRLAGLSEDEAMKITGHKTRSMLTRYNIVSEKDLKASGEKMEAFFAERKQERAAKLKRVK